MPRKKKNKDNSELDEVLDVDETDDEEKVKGGTLWTQKELMYSSRHYRQS